ncbi:hypothetical protein FRB90_007758 [Tulasnella sp. 427]|nr:hypothetical protein FRB90_007758 [Tulasnella sp. 427]
MNSSHQPQWEELSAEQYIREELEFCRRLAVEMAQKHPSWRDNHREPYVRCICSVVFGAIKDVEERLFPITEETVDEYPAIQDPLDSLYQVPWTPTSLYHWIYLTLKFDCPHLADEEQRSQILLRMQRSVHYDTKFFDSEPEPTSPGDGEDAEMTLNTPPPLEETNPTIPFIHRLFPELLCNILTRAHDGLLYFPVIISHVDSNFRAVAQSFPALWTTIDTNLPIPFITMYLQNSKSLLLDVQMNITHSARRSQSIAQLRTITDLLAEHRPRIASLIMTGDDHLVLNEVVERMLSGAEAEYPQLRRLGTGSSSQYPTRALSDRQRTNPLKYPVVLPPHVQDLCLRGYRSSDWNEGFALPVSGLKRLHFISHYTLTRPEFLGILANLPSLEALIIESCDTNWSPLPIDWILIEYLLRSLITPKLISLKAWWSIGRKGAINHTEPLLTILRGCPQLQTLDLCNLEAHASWWKDVFITATSVKHLLLRNNEFLAEELEPLWDPTPVLPHLKHLALENVFGLTSDVVRRIVAARPGLQFVELRGWDATRVAKEDVEFLRRSVQDVVLETFGGTKEAASNGDGDDWSSSGTPSEGSWLSGDQDVVNKALIIQRSHQEIAPPQFLGTAIDEHAIGFFD